MFEKVDIPVLGLIENMAVFTCPNCDTQHHIFGTGGAQRDADKLGINYLGAAPLHMSIRESGDQGCPVATTETQTSEIFQELANSVWQQALQTAQRE
jgi:ATP-binding protein involved in chromosome partitioning